jgi:hypothetical protein
MHQVRIEATVQNDGELHLTDLPWRKGDKVEAVVSILQASDVTPDEQEKQRQEALQRFLARASASKFRSVGPYPTRDELHERR